MSEVQDAPMASGPQTDANFGDLESEVQGLKHMVSIACDQIESAFNRDTQELAGAVARMRDCYFVPEADQVLWSVYHLQELISALHKRYYALLEKKDPN